jgi:hypothetical protein
MGDGLKRAFAAAKATRAHKHGARATVVDGIAFPSQAEANRWCELRLLERAGEIQHLNRQPSYRVFEGAGGVEITYTPDFIYYAKAGGWTVEEVKGHRDTAYLLRRKMFLSCFSDFSFYEIRGKKRLRVYLTKKGICRTKLEPATLPAGHFEREAKARAADVVATSKIGQPYPPSAYKFRKTR